MRIVEKGARQCDHIRSAFGDNGFRLFGADDPTDHARGNAGLATDLFGNQTL